ncbi:hypothetical protein LSCM1_07127 [Leishmania martiniquensis]|uniref:LP7 n=1 Tax=Leishmania martiniquensis TaxID=1580590 RepID=A0A836KTH0_9TRYP|nr:hypothetical protein LSCM1_07127 [Leishmania martiniquensis]
MQSIRLLVLFAALLSIFPLTSADVVLRPCTTTEDLIGTMTDGNSSHYLLFFDSLDVSSLRVYNTLSGLKMKRAFNVDTVDIRESQSSWLRTVLEVNYVPMLSYIKWLPSGDKVVHAYPSMDFGSPSLIKFLQQY